MRLLVALLLVLWASCAAGAPTLTGPLIHAVTTDRQMYGAGQRAAVQVTLTNNTGAAFSGTITGRMTGRGDPVGEPASVKITGLAGGASQTVDLLFSLPAGVAYRGYHVALAAVDGSGAQVDAAAAAVDVSSDWTRYARTCWVAQTFTQWGDHTPPKPDPVASVAGLNAWHCNVLQMYNQLYRHHIPYTPAETWINADGQTQSRELLQHYLEQAKRFGMGTLAYVPMYAADTKAAPRDFLHDGSGVALSWGMFTSDCAPACGLGNMQGFPSGTAEKSSFGLMDPTNTDWQAYWATAVQAMLDGYPYDGIFIDSYGNPGTKYRADGSKIDFTHAWSGFLNAGTRALQVPMVINPTNGFNLEDIARNARQPFYYSERYPINGDMPTYSSIDADTFKVRNEAGRNIAVNWAVYMDYSYAKSVCVPGGQKSCRFNTPGLLYIDAQMFASGAYHAYIADNDRFISNDGYPSSSQLETTPALIAAEYNLQTFGVAYEKLLRDNVVGLYGAGINATITSGATSSIDGSPGKVYALTKGRPGFVILHLLNYQQLSSVQNQDLQANYPASKTTGPLGVRLYYTSTGHPTRTVTGRGAGTLDGENKLWVASPDIDHGAPHQLTYTLGTDASGNNYIDFVGPPLTYWTMFWLETDALARSDYAAP